MWVGEVLSSQRASAHNGKGVASVCGEHAEDDPCEVIHRPAHLPSQEHRHGKALHPRAPSNASTTIPANASARHPCATSSPIATTRTWKCNTNWQYQLLTRRLAQQQERALPPHPHFQCRGRLTIVPSRGTTRAERGGLPGGRAWAGCGRDRPPGHLFSQNTVLSRPAGHSAPDAGDRNAVRRHAKIITGAVDGGALEASVLFSRRSTGLSVFAGQDRILMISSLLDLTVRGAMEVAAGSAKRFDWG